MFLRKHLGDLINKIVLTFSGFKIAFVSSAVTAIFCAILIPILLNISRVYTPVDYSLPWLEGIEAEIERYYRSFSLFSY